MRPDNHIRQKQGCFNCFLDKHRLTKLSTERVNNLKRIHNNKYSYNDLSIDKGFINIICPKHGEFKQYLYFHEYGHGCSQCNSSSRGEDYIKSYLENNNICYIRNHIFDGCKNKKGLRFDFYLQELDTIIEYDGEHHFKENKYFGIGNLEYVRKNDEIKNRFCQENNIKMIRIPYYDYDKIDDILSIIQPSKEDLV
jgi:very-short-patch-repair endonuclease